MEETIGFDLRSVVPDPSWTADRRTRHLLRRDVPSVRSVDPLVWERPPGLPPSLESPEPTGPAFERYDLLGYDVADYDLLGSLTNCGYTPDEVASLAPVWAPLLNEWHLFANPEDAMAYAAVMARRVPEHAPFYGYGIYQLS